MEAVNILHMNSGDGESSYSNNSLVQSIMIRNSLPVLEQTIKSMVSLFGVSFKIADLGCSSGPNTLLTASNIMDIVHEVCKQNNRKTPDFQVCLNDLFGNDFNTTFQSLPDFYAKLNKEKEQSFGSCFVSAVPGSFYDRLFLDESLHFVHSSNSIHYLSQVPEGLENNTSHIHMGKKSPQNVFQAYKKQYVSDFTRFLQVRSKEIVTGGRMVLTFTARSISDTTSDDCTALLTILSESLLDLVKEGLVKQSDFNSFNIPYYAASEDELRDVVQNEGSFSVDIVSGFHVNWDPYDTDYTNTKASHELSLSHGENTMKIGRAVIEPLLTSHFGSSVMDKLFKIYAKRVSQHLVIKKTRHFSLTVSLTKK